MFFRLYLSVGKVKHTKFKVSSKVSGWMTWGNYCHCSDQAVDLPHFSSRTSKSQWTSLGLALLVVVLYTVNWWHKSLTSSSPVKADHS